MPFYVTDNDIAFIGMKNDFITQILREINLGDSRSAKSAISTHFKALNIYFYEFLHFLKAEISQISKIQNP